MRCPAYDDRGRQFNGPHPVECRQCSGTRKIQRVLFHGRWRTRPEIVKWFLAQREWRRASVLCNGSTVVLTLEASEMRLESFTPEEIEVVRCRT